MIDLERQNDIQKMVRSGIAYKQALIWLNQSNDVPIGIMKDEIGDIVGSSWATDFNERFPHLVEAYYLLSGYSLPDQPDGSTDIF